MFLRIHLDFNRELATVGTRTRDFNSVGNSRKMSGFYQMSKFVAGFRAEIG